MKVKLIAVTQPVPPAEHWEPITPSDLVGYCARVSNPANQAKSPDKLIAYLIKNKHWSPFEMVSMVIEINTTRAIARQILRHRSFHFQEFSQRYAEVKDMEFELSDARLQDDKNRQNSIDTDNVSLKEQWDFLQLHLINLSQDAYKWALDNGIAKEVARNVLPEGLTPSRMYMAGTVRDWFHYCQLRMGNGTQKEHQEIAKACWEILVKEFPVLADVPSAEDDAYNRGWQDGFERGSYETMTQEDVS